MITQPNLRMTLNREINAMCFLMAVIIISVLITSSFSKASHPPEKEEPTGETGTDIPTEPTQDTRHRRNIPIPAQATPAGLEEAPDENSVPVNGYVAIESRGMLLERTGTLISHASYVSVSVIIRGNRVNFRKLDASCAPGQIDALSRECALELLTLQNMTDAIFLSREQLKTPNLCKTFNIENCQGIPRRQKRFILGAAALATAGTALALTPANSEAIRNVHERLINQEEALDILSERLDASELFQEKTIQGIEDLFGIVKGLNAQIARNTEDLNCAVRIMGIRELMAQSLRQVREALQFILKGRSYGRVTPSLLNTAELRYMVKAHIGKSSRFSTARPPHPS